MTKKEFQAVFQINKMIIFEVSYYTLITNENARFATSAAVFIKNKRDFSRCGQCQNDALKKHRKAYAFYEKWDTLHSNNLTEAQYNELMADLETLKNQYNYMIDFLDETEKPYSPHFSFMRLVEFSKQEVKKAKSNCIIINNA